MRPVEPQIYIEQRIYLIRCQKVMLDFHLAQLYGVATGQLKRAVRRNRARFPEDFLFILTNQEYDSLRCHIGTLKRGEHSKYPPYAFTEQGVAMLSTVLRSERAISVNIAIMRTFVKLREYMGKHSELARKLGELERRVVKHDTSIVAIFEVIRRLMQPPEKPKRPIDFKIEDPKARYRVKRPKLDPFTRPTMTSGTGRLQRMIRQSRIERG
ncbi:MAG: ORF6N domain-containing protein [Candidatus Edwardsbacteria bacterium]|nr:ORF6N domain-containing protein [Candidatus Edwardsbacteria bacterium]